MSSDMTYRMENSLKENLVKLRSTLKKVEMAVSQLSYIEKGESVDTKELEMCWQSLQNSVFELKNIQYMIGRGL